MIGKQLKRLRRNIRKESIIGLSKLSKKRFIFRCGEASLRVPIVYGLGSNNINPLDDKFMFNLLKVALNIKNGVVIDIGAHVGELLLNLFCADSQRTYIGFEPNPSSYFYIQELIDQNLFTDASVFPIAISNQESVEKLSYSGIGDPAASLIYRQNSRNQVKVFTKIFDNIAPNLVKEPIAFIKIDVEGAEADVLGGMKVTVMRERPFIYCELTNPHHPAKLGPLIKWLNELHYSAGRLTAIGKDYKIEWIDSFESRICENYFLCPAEAKETSLRQFNSLLEHGPC